MERRLVWSPGMDDVNTLVAAFEQAADAVVITDISGVIRYVNAAFERVSGYARDEAVGSHVRMLKSGCHEPAFYRGLWETVSSGRVWRGVFVNRAKSGCLYEDATVISPIRNEVGQLTGYLAVKRSGACERPSGGSVPVRQTMELMGRLAGGAAHDFNNALMTIMGTAEMLDTLLPATPECREAMADLKAACDRGVSLTRQLSTLGRARRHALMTLDLGGIVGGLEKMLRRLLGEEIQLLVCRCSEPAIVRFDFSCIERLIIQFAIHVWQTMRPGSVFTVGVSVANAVTIGEGSHAADSAGGWVELRMASAYGGRAAAFGECDSDDLARGGEAVRVLQDICAEARDLVRQSAGRLTLQRQKDGGMALSVALPRMLSLDVLNASGVRGEALSGSETVLVAEDEGRVRDLVRVALSRLGYHVLEASDGPTALQIAAAHSSRIDVLLADVVMPGMSGHELADQMRALYPHIKVICMSGYASEIAGARGAFLAKPFSGARLARVVREVIDRA